MVWHIYIRNSIDRSSSTIPRRRVNLIFQTEMTKKKKNLMLLIKFVIEKVAVLNRLLNFFDNLNYDKGQIVRLMIHDG